jgi:hypothetical protein
MNQACKLVSGVTAGLTVRIKNARIRRTKKIVVEVPSENEFSRRTQMSEITGKVRVISLGMKIDHSNDFKEVWLLVAKRLRRKVIDGRRMMREMIFTGKAESGATTPKL